mgnify:CR=1 FL=1
MGKAEEWRRVDCFVVCEESLIWFEGMPVVVGDELTAAGLFACGHYVQLIPIMQTKYIRCAQIYSMCTNIS